MGIQRPIFASSCSVPARPSSRNRYRRTNWLAEAGCPMVNRPASQAFDTEVLCLSAAASRTLRE